MPRRKQEEPASEGAPEWMTTYSDLVTLLMCFFVLLFSMAVIDKQKFVEVANSLRSSFQEVNGAGDKFDSSKGNALISIMEAKNSNEIEEIEHSDNLKMSEQSQEEAEKLKNIKKELEESIKDLQLGDYVKVIEEKTTITLRIDSAVLFKSGSAEIENSGKEVLKRTGLLLKEIENEVFVQGHTDNIPIYTSAYPTNWELSAKRAINVVLYLIEATGMNPGKLTATGNGEFRPLVPNDSEENREKNRRIDIVIMKGK
ncbi:MAG: OmpA family protein [Clostridia bacterium]|nr:OmpA family protein [Clostridia bacterium]